jgi:hypothetical protein
MAYFKIEVDGPMRPSLSGREIDILQTTFLNLAAMTNALIIGKGVMLNPPEEGKMGITFAYPEKLSEEKESEIKEAFLKKVNVFFQMSKLELTAEIKE